MRRLSSVVLWVAAAVFLVPIAASAQASISGVIQDSSGAVLPGVTVEASSAVLIEKTRSVVSDSSGRFTIVDLRPGTYSITFSLAGFSTVKRDGIELTGAFSAEVNANLRVGALEETITVSGASPVVDVKNTLSQSVLTKEQIEILGGARTLKNRAALIPGVVVPNGNTGVAAHGSDSQDSNTMVDGYKTGQHLVGRGTGQLGVGSVTQSNEASIEELVYDTSGQGAEYASSGVRMNMIPKEGGNRFLTEGYAYASNQHFERSNITPYLNSIGLKYAPQLFFWDFNPGVGGPIKKDKLWYFAAFTGQNQNSQILDIYFKPDEPSTPEECRNRTANNLCLANTGAHFDSSETIRVTHQMTSKHKLRYSLDNTRYVRLRGNFSTGGLRVSPEASWYLPLYPTYVAQAKYTAPLTNRLLVEAGLSYERGDFQVNFQPANSGTDIADIDLGTFVMNENHNLSYTYQQRLWSTKAAISYVTGSHSFKTGFENRSGNAIQDNRYNSDISARYRFNGAPLSVDVRNGPAANTQNINFDGGAYVQDQWRLQRFTINLGGRWDHFNASVPANSAPASLWTPAVTAPEIPNVPNFHNFNVRVGAAWDVFGDGRTAVKGSVGRYVANHALDLTGPANPLYSLPDRRSWTDLDGNGTVVNLQDGTPQYNEIGPAANKNFGTLAGTTLEDPNLIRDKNWSYEATAQHTLLPRVSVGGSYFRRRYYDLIFTNNLAVDPVAGYIPITINGPVNPLLPGGGGQPFTIYNLRPELLGVVKNQFQNSSTNERVYDSFEVNFNAPLPRNGFVLSSWTALKVRVNQCQFSNPNSIAGGQTGALYCDSTLPFRHIYKLSGGLAVTPPYISANYAVTSAIAGTPLTGGGSLNVNLMPPGYHFNDYYKILDIRVARLFTMGRLKMTTLAEFDNLLNMTNVVSVTEAYGANWLRANALQRGLNVRWGLQIRY